MTTAQRTPATTGPSPPRGRLCLRQTGRIEAPSGAAQDLEPKDAVLLASSFARVHGEPAVAAFRAQKQRWDPDHLLQTDLSRRLGV